MAVVAVDVVVVVAMEDVEGEVAAGVVVDAVVNVVHMMMTVMYMVVLVVDVVVRAMEAVEEVVGGAAEPAEQEVAVVTRIESENGSTYMDATK